MSDPRDITIRAQTLGGQWEVVGVDRLRGIVPENVQLTANEWGSDQCSFTLRGQTGPIRADLSAWTPIEIDVAGRTVWDGRITETPTQDSSEGRIVNVQAEGWQYHLDDDVYLAAYVRSNLGDWQDVRSNVLAYLPTFTATPQVNGTTLQWSNGSTITLGDCAGILLDCGADPAGWVKRISVDWTAFASAAASIIARCADSPTVLVSGGGGVSGTNYDSAFTTALAASGTVTQSGTFATARRYVSVILYYPGATTTATADYGITITGIRLYRDTAYESGNASILKADTVIKDSLAKATNLLSTDTTGILAGTISIPEHAPGLISPREAWIANAYENYDTRVEVGRRPVFRPRLTAPLYEIGEWAGADFSDASVNSGQDIVNRVVVQGTGPDGGPLTVERTAGALNPTGPSVAITSPAVTNGEFEVNLTGWTGTPAPTRTTTAGEFYTGIAGLKWSGTDDQAVQCVGLTGTFQAGMTYIITAVAKASVGSIVWKPRFGVTPTTPGGDWSAPASWALTTSFQQFVAAWTPKTTVTSGVEFWLIGQGTATYYLDSVGMRRATPTLADRREFLKSKILPVSTSITTAVGQRFGDLYLTAHRTTPFRGGMQTVGQGGVRRVLGGQSPHPAALLLDTTQLIRCPVVHPDTGDWTRDARMASVTYDHDSLTSTVSLDEDREGFDTLLARYALVVSQRR